MLQHKALDGGWGYMIIVGACIITASNAAVERSFSIVYLELLERYHRSASATAWVGGLLFGVRLLLGFLATIIGNRYSYRIAVIAGSCLRAAGYMLAAFSPTLEIQYLTIGIMTGLGGALCHTSAFIMITEYFDRKRAKAFGISTAFAGIGACSFPMVTQVIFERYGFAVGMSAMACVSLQMCIAGALFRPLEDNYIPKKLSTRHANMIHASKMYTKIKWEKEHSTKANIYDLEHQHKQIDWSENNNNKVNEAPVAVVEKKKKKLIDLSILKNRSYVLLCLGILFGFMGSCVFIMMLPAICKSRGISRQDATYLVSTTGAVDLVSRLLLGVVYDAEAVRGSRTVLYASLMTLCGFSLLVAARATEFSGFVLAVFIFGISNSSMVSQRASVMGDILQSHQLSSAIGVGNFFQGIGLLTGPISAGFIHDWSSSYGSAYTFSAGLVVLGGFVIICDHVRILPFLGRRYKRLPLLDESKLTS